MREPSFKLSVTFRLYSDYIFRFKSLEKKKKLCRLEINKGIKDDLKKILRETEYRRLSYSNRNPESRTVPIVTFNIPEENIAYKAIFADKHCSAPSKVFKSVTEGKWHVVKKTSADLVRFIAIKHLILMNDREEKSNEYPTFAE